MRNPGGQATDEFRDGTKRERDTFTCAHGNEIVFVAVGQTPSEAGAYCQKCDSHICKKCASMGECLPFEKWLDWKEGGNRRQANEFARQLAEAEFKAARIRLKGHPNGFMAALAEETFKAQMARLGSR